MSRAARIECWLVAMVLICHAALLTWSGWRHSPTLNEPAHLVAGISHWEFGRFELYRVNPPLVRMVAALPVLAVGCETDWSRFYEGPGARPVFSMGEDWIAANGERSLWLMTLARWACIPFSLLGGLVCFVFARALWGRAGGIVALTLWCFSPNILGHGSLITPDVSAAALGILAGYGFWRWLNEPDWPHAFVAGLTLGLAELTKMTWIVLFGLWPVLWLVWMWWFGRGSRVKGRGQRRGEKAYHVGRAGICRVSDAAQVGQGMQEPSDGIGESQQQPGCYGTRFARSIPRVRPLRQLAQLVVILALGLYVLNLGYGFDGTFTRLKDFAFVSKSFCGTDTNAPRQGGNRFKDSWLGDLPIPVPKQYLLGLDVQRQDFESYSWPSYLHGVWQDTGWWYYYLYGLAVKVPVGTWLLFVLALITLRVSAARIDRHGVTQARDGDTTHCKSKIEDYQFAVDNPCSVIDQSLTDSQRSALDSGFPTLSSFVLLGPAVTVLVLVSSQTEFNHHLRYVFPALPFVFVFISQTAWGIAGNVWMSRIAIAACLTWSVGSSLWIYPHSLSYFNELIGGSKNGHKHLIHSSLDWGQDLLYVRHWLDSHPGARPFYLAYYGAFDPRDASIPYELPPQKPEEQDGQTWLDHLPRGWYAISANYMVGDRRAAFDGTGNKQAICDRAYTSFQNLTPTARLGASIWLYKIPSTAVK